MKLFAKIVLPLVALLLGLAGANYLLNSKVAAARTDSDESATLVEVVEITRATVNPHIPATGVVQAARSVVIQPEVSGRIVSLNASFVPGGLVVSGDELLKVDDRDYKLAVAQQKQSISAANLELTLQKGRKRIAEREWKLLEAAAIGGDSADAAAGRKLALREPQIAHARAAVSAARSGLKRAQLVVDRAPVLAPFNGMFLEETAEIGQFVGPSSRLGTMVGTDDFWVRISVPMRTLTQFALPKPGSVDGEGSARVLVRLETGAGETVTREASVLRLLGDVDPKGRMARLLVGIKDPLGLADGEFDGAPLLIGSYVNVEIVGHAIESVAKVPRQALRNGTDVWVMTAEKTLEYRPVVIVWRDAESVFVSEGLKDGDTVVTSRIATPIPGMVLTTDANDLIPSTPVGDGSDEARALEKELKDEAPEKASNSDRAAHAKRQ